MAARQTFQEMLANSYASNQQSQYSWHGVIDFLNNQLKSLQQKESDWIEEKKQLIVCSLKISWY